MKNATKKTLAFLLTLVMLINTFPISAFADTKGVGQLNYAKSAANSVSIRIQNGISLNAGQDKSFYLVATASETSKIAGYYKLDKNPSDIVYSPAGFSLYDYHNLYIVTDSNNEHEDLTVKTIQTNYANKLQITKENGSGNYGGYVFTWTFDGSNYGITIYEPIKAKVAIEDDVNPSNLYIAFVQKQIITEWGNSNQPFYLFEACTASGDYQLPERPMYKDGYGERAYDPDRPLEVFLVDCPENQQPIHQLNNSGALIYNGGYYKDYPVTITPSGESNSAEFVITIGNASVGPVEHTASISGLTSWPSDYYVTAKVSDTNYYAPINSDGTIGSFATADGQPTTNGKIPDKADANTVKIVLQADASYTEVTKVTATDSKEYTVSGPVLDTSTHDYHFEMLPPANVIVSIENEGTGSITLSNRYSLVVGWNDGPDSYQYTELKSSDIINDHEFYISELGTSGYENKPLLVLIKTYPAGDTSDPRDNNNGTLVIANRGLTSNPNTVSDGDNQYTYTLVDDYTEENGVRHYTIRVKKLERAKHTAIISLADGVSTDNMYVVFRQPIQNSNEMAYCAIKVNESGEYESTAKLINPNHGEQDFSATAETEVLIVVPKDNQQIQSWMFQKSNFDTQNGLNVYHNGDLYQNIQDQIVTITPNAKETDISIGSAKYTARLDLYDAWNVKHESQVTFAGVDVTASNGTAAYTGTITGNGPILTEAGDLPSNLTTWAFSSNTFGGYTLSSTTPVKEGQVYVFEAHKPDTYQVEMLYKEAWGEEEASQVSFSAVGTVIATDSNGNEYYGTINEDGSLTMDPVPAITSWQINDNNTIGDFVFKPSDTAGQLNPSVDNGTHTYILNLRKARTHRVEIEYYDSWGRGKLTGDVPVGDGYTIEATGNRTTYTGAVDAATGKVSFEDELPDITAWTVKHNNATEDPQRIGEFRTDFGPDNPFEQAKYDAELNTAAGYYVITATKPNTYSAEVSFYAVDEEDPLDNVDLPERYVIKATAADGTVYTGAVETDGSVTWSESSTGWAQIESFKFYKANGTDEVTRFGDYLMEVVSYQDTDLAATYGAYQIIGRAARMYPSQIKYAPENTEALKAYYYLVASVDGEKVAYATLPGTTSRLTFIPFGAAAGKLHFRMMLAEAGNTPAATGMKLPEDTAFTLIKSENELTPAQIHEAEASPAVVDDYTLELVPVIEATNEGSGSADEDTLVLKAQKQWTGNEIHITTYDYNDNPENPEKPFGPKYYVRVRIREQETNEVVGWNLIPITDWDKRPDQGQGHTAIVTVDRFTTLAEAPLDNDNRDKWTTFDESKHYIEVDTDEYPARVVRIEHPNGINWENAIDKNKAKDEPPEGYKYVKGSQESTYYQIKLAKAKPIDYHVKLKFDTTDTSKINLDGGLYVKVTIEHQSGPDTYAWVPVNNADYKNPEHMTVDTENGCTYIDIPITEWRDAEGRKLENEKYKGTEENIKVELVGTSDPNAKPGHSTPMKTGAYVNNAEITAYPTLTEGIDRFTDEQHEKEIITDVVSLSVEPDKFDGYSLEYILNGYNIVTLCPNKTASPSNSGAGAFGDGDFLMRNHCMGGVLVRGDIIHITGTGVADSEFIDKPSVVGGYVPASQAPFINNRENNNNDWNAYIGSVNTVVGNTVNGVTASGAPSKPRPDGTIRGYTGSAGYTAAYGDTYIDWDKLQNTICNTSDDLAAAGREKTDVVYGNQYETFREVHVDVTLGDNVTINYPPNVKLIVNILAPGDLDLTNSENIPSTIINNTGTGTYIAPKVQVNGKDLNTVEDGSGMSLVWNFPNAAEVDLTTEVTPFFGHIVAPRSYIFVEGGNYSGCMVGNKVSSAGEGHLYPYNGGKLILTDVGFEASKTIDEVPPEADQLFYFELAELDQDGSLDNNAGQWVTRETVRNKESSVEFEKIEYDKIGTYYYRISEYQFSTISNIKLDTTEYIVKSVVEEHVEGSTGTLTSKETYYRVPEDATEQDYIESYTEDETTKYRIKESALQLLTVPEGATGAEIAEQYLTFDNKSSDNASITAKKTLKGEALQDQRFSFTIAKKSEPEASVGTVDETKLNSTATNNASGTVNFGKLVFTLNEGVDSGTWVYTVKETVPNPQPEGYIYDQSEYEITFTVTRVEGIPTVSKSITQVKDEKGAGISKPVSAINFINERKTSNLVISKSVVSPIPAEATQTFSFKVKFQLDGKNLSGTFGNYTFNANGEATITVAGGSSVTIPGLPTGTTYTVIEAEDSHFTVDKENSTVSGTIAEGDHNTAAFINTRKTGKVSISKTVISPIPGETTQNFTFTITLSDTTISETFNGTVTGSTESQEIEFTDGVATVTVAGGKTLTIEGLPTDLTYEVTEAVDNLFETTKVNDKGTITESGMTAAFTNTRKTGNLKVEKQVTGTSDKSKVFTFTVTLKKDAETTISGTYPVDVTHVSGTQKEDFRNKNTGDYEITFDDGGTAYFDLKADEYVIISGIPQGAVYTVTEDTTQSSYPQGYELSSPNGSAQGTISATTSDVTFVNDYHLNTTSVGFGGTKSIEGTDSTEKVFTFELYQTGQDYKIAENQEPINTVSTSGLISASAGQNYSFDTITYDGNDVDETTRQKHFYYVVKEKALDQAKGWTIDNTEYKIHVTVTDDGKGNLTSAVTRYDADGTPTETTQDPGKLNFKNTYEAKGTLKFRAKKIFTNGNLNEHPFKIRMTWVKGDQNPEAIPDTTDNTKPACQWTATLNADSDKQTVTFDNVKEFVKDKDQNDTTSDYWFLIEEIDDNANTDNIQNDANPKRWIKVTVTDNEDGTLKVEKDPATTASGSDTDLDVVFTNEQLGSVKVTKTFDLNGATLPNNFQITATYTADETNYTKILKINANTEAGEIGPDAGSSNPYTWTIDNLPIGTRVTFTESGYTVDGYSTTTTYTGFAEGVDKVLTSEKTAPSGTFINTYTRDTGKLEIQKTVSVNDQTDQIDTSLVDDTYTFHLQSADNVAPATDKYFTIIISGGKATSSELIEKTGNKWPDGATLTCTDGKVTLSGLPTGSYTVTEELTADQRAKGITIAEQPTTAITIDKYNSDTDIRTAAFRNNREVGELEISKAVVGTTDKTKVFSFEVSLTAPSGITLDSTYPAVKITGTTETPTTVTITNGKLAPNVVLKAEEKLVIRNLPNGTGYTVKEITPLPSGYEKIEPSGNPNGEISRDPSVAAFVNNYKLETTSVAFGGLKTIEGTDSTNKHFCFELYETGTDETDKYKINAGQEPIQTVEITDTIQRASGKSYSFDAITYSVNSEKDDRGYHYYVVKEHASTTNDGWDYSDAVYYIKVNVYDDTYGHLATTVEITDSDGHPITDPSDLNFHNKYSASGTVSFKAKKTFIKGDLSEHNFDIRLTYVTGDKSETPVKDTENKPVYQKTITLNTAGATQTAEFSDVLQFVKSNTQDDTANTYWFLIEETDNNSSTSIDYDKRPQRWIKVTLQDEGDGRITAIKDPAATNDLDAEFVNEQLGSVKISKAFDGLEIDQFPKNFMITATYPKDGETKTVELTTSSDGVSGTGTASDPFIWEIKNLPINTTVTFIESGIDADGYSVTAKFDGTVVNDYKGTVDVMKTALTGAFVNTYVREEGSLKITKHVLVNNAAPTKDAEYALVDGTYIFTVTGKGMAAGTNKEVKIFISQGAVTGGTVKDISDETGTNTVTSLTPAEGYIEISNLPTGDYEIVEEISSEMTEKGIALKDPTNNKITVTVDADNTTPVPTADFTNEKEVGELEISKSVEGTEDKSIDFTFEVSLTPPNGVELANTYPATIITRNGSTETSVEVPTVTITNGKIDPDVKLKADQSLVIRELPKGTVYTVTEINNPAGYNKKSPAGDATGTIDTTPSAAAFVNRYSLTETNVTFGGTKYIEGRDSTNKVFTFDLYEADNETYSIEGKSPIQSVSTTGTINKTTGQRFSFNTITYTAPTTKYYVVKERTLDSKTGWTISTTVYTKKVVVEDIGGGQLGKTITPAGEDNLDFTNSYEATGNVYFRAKKTFKNGKLNEHPFQIRLTQVEGEGSTTQATGADVVLTTPVTKTVNASVGNQTVTFNKNDGIVDFIRNKSKDNVADEHGTAKEYWFLIEELDENHDESAIAYDDHPQQWIKVTLTDDGNGQLTAVKEPAATNGLDVEFINEQLGSVKVSKEFAGLTTAQIPADFTITAEYTVGNETKTVELTKSSTGVSGEGTAENPYVWEIKGLPIGTVVSFTESGMTVNGYSVETKFNDEVTADQKGTVKAAKDAPTGAFLNAYTRDVGKLEIQKTVSVNGQTTDIDTTLVDGTYTFYLQSGTGVAPATDKSFTITIGSGKATAAALVNNTGDQWPDGAALTCEDEKVILSGLPTGSYTVTEVLSAEQTAEGIRIAVQPTSAIEVGKYTTDADIKLAEFQNNREVGDLEISKKVSGTSDKTINFTFEITLKNGDDPFSGTYEVVATDAVKAANSGISTDGKITFNANGKATVFLKADEKITIKNLPVGISYKVEEKNIPDGYNKTKPAGAATDTIAKGTKQEEFENQYSLGTTNMTFGGRKTISGTNSTKAVFTFELWKTGANFDITANEAKRLQTVSTTGTIATTGQEYNFDPITYTAADKGTHYYVIKETAKVKAETGWTENTTIYNEKVEVKDAGGGVLQANVVSGTAADKLDFTNAYEATGTVGFKAKKIFTNGNLQEHPIKIRLTYVDKDKSDEPVTDNEGKAVYQQEKTLDNNGETQTVEFASVLQFVKKTGQDDTANTYWFLIEEIDDNQTTEIKYDDNKQRWIKVTLTDNDNGTLTANKEPGTVSDGSDTDLDAVFTNEKLGSVQVSKVFDGLTSDQYPNKFKITATYTVAGEKQEKELKIADATNTGTSANPCYVWVIDKLPLNTIVTFTENGITVNGYSVATTYNGKATTDLTGTATAKFTETAESTGAFVNTYTRERGKLNLKKTVSVNGGNTKGETTLVDGTYTFNLVGSGLADGESGKVSIRIDKGAVTEATIEEGLTGANVKVVDGVAEIYDLKTGQYNVTEDPDTSGNFITSTSETRGTVTVESGESATIQTAAFNNNRDVGDLRISKTVQRTSNRTIVFEFTVTLTRKDNDTTTPLSGTYPVEATDAVKTLNGITDGKITFTNGVATIKLHADEELIIRNLPGKTNYTVHETTPPTGYSQTKPSGGGNATGTISSKQSEAAFENTYNLSSTNLPFSGKKKIEGTDSTEQVFEFEVYETGSNYEPKPGDKPILTAKTSGTITQATPGAISFGSVKYDQDAVGHEYYYVICEKELTENGWTNSPVRHKRHVVVGDGGSGKITLTITDDKGEDSNVSNLDFTNTYVATGTLSFTARKTFTNGDLNSNPFQVKLTQVTGKGKTDKVSAGVMPENPITKPVPADGIVKFENIATFTKNKDQDDTKNTYWFMLEEDVSGIDSANIKDGVRYDTTQKWIKVTMTDDGVGHLIITKDPAATKDGETDIDADFVNEQLGSVKVSKEFAGLTAEQIPANFKITAEYQIAGQAKTKVVFTPKTPGTAGTGLANDPYIWEINNLPIDTEVTFTESGMTVNGYSYTTTFNGIAASDHKGTTKAAKTAPNGAFVNAYTRDRGTLVIKKTAVVPAGIPIPQSYTFTVQGEDGLFYGTNGTSSAKAIELKVTPGDTGLKLVKLPTQRYTVTEVTGTNNASIRIDGCDVTVNGNNQTVSISKNATETVTVTNSYTMKTGEKTVYDSVTVNKQDQAGTALNGARFTLYSDQECKVSVKEYEGGTFEISTKDLSSVLPKANNESVTLYLLETEAPEGYGKDETKYPVVITTKISDPTYDATEDKYITTTTYAITINGSTSANVTNNKKTGDKTVHGSVTVSKQDQKGTALDGATFMLYSDQACTKAVKEYRGGRFDIRTQDLTELLPKEKTDSVKLYLKETKAPDGYVLDDTVHTVVITVDISGPAYDKTENAFVTTTTYSIEIDEKASANIPNKKTEVRVQKTDVASGEELTGATIQILDKNGKLVAEWVSDKDAPHIETGLKTGEEYTLRETVAPEGYTVTADTKFSIDEKGEITYSGTVSTDENGNTVTLVEDSQTCIKVQKTDITDNEQELIGAHIQILDKDGNLIEEWVSEEGKPHEVKGLKTGEEYTLRETVAPEGYDITTDTTFTIDEKGEVTSTGTIREDGVLLVEDAKLPRTSATVKKIWNDDNNRDGKRPESLKIELLADGEKTGKSVTLSEQNGWIGRIGDLLKCTAADHREIKYTWAEPKVEGYTLSGNTTNGTLTTLTNTYGPETTQISVKKAWVDDGKHPDEIKVQLFADGQAVGEAVKLNEGNGWKYSWSNLCKNDAGEEILYTVAETEIPEGYAAKITGSMTAGYVITNTLQKGGMVIEKKFDIREPEDEPDEEEMKTEIQVVKIWDDNDNRDGNRPEKITIRLYAGGKEVKTAELSAKNGWKRTFGDLPKFVDGHPIHYSVKEDPVKWYVPEIRGFTITNRYQPETTSMAIQKVWDDAGNEKFRPKSVRMKLSNGMSIELNEKNGWSDVITDLPKYVNGKEAEYTWTEAEVLGYQIKSTVVEGNLTVITNEPYHNDGTPKGKKPASRGPKTEPLDDYETPLGVSEMINHVGDCFD